MPSEVLSKLNFSNRYTANKLSNPISKEALNMSKIHFNTAFEGLTEDQVEDWKSKNYKNLIGSAIFTKNSSLLSRVIAFFEKKLAEDDSKFVPSHVGTIIEYENDLYIFNMSPMRANLVPLTDYILETPDDFVVIFRNFKINTDMISANLSDLVGKMYPIFSVVKSVITGKRDFSRFCSGIHLKQLKLQGLFKEVSLDITPLELYKMLITSEIYK